MPATFLATEGRWPSRASAWSAAMDGTIVGDQWRERGSAAHTKAAPTDTVDKLSFVILALLQISLDGDGRTRNECTAPA
jgi:hypothetical protein